MDIALHVMIDEPIKQELGRRAEVCRMSLSDYVRNIFDDHIKNKTGFVIRAE